jgi:signal peptidase II
MRLAAIVTASPQARVGAIILGCVAVGAAFADLATKAVAEATLRDAGVMFLPMLSFELHYNRGISFSLFPAETGTGLAGLLAFQAAAIVVLAWLTKAARRHLESLAFALIAGGALGNFLDRLHDGTVTDFLDLHPMAVKLFTFNLADVFISVGTSLVLLDVMLAYRAREPIKS